MELVKLQQWVVHKGLKRSASCSRARQGPARGHHQRRSPERVSPGSFASSRCPPHGAGGRASSISSATSPPAGGGRGSSSSIAAGTTGPAWKRVMGFAARRRATNSWQAPPWWRKAMVDSGIILLKYWLEVTPEAGAAAAGSHRRRSQDLGSSPHGHQSPSTAGMTTRARDAMFIATDTAWAPGSWPAPGQKRVRLQHHLPTCCRTSPRGAAVSRSKLPRAQDRQGHLGTPLRIIPGRF